MLVTEFNGNDTLDIQAMRCRQLWAAVLNEAIDDARRQLAGDPAKFLQTDAFLRNDDPVRWFKESGPHYQLICDLAGVNAGQVRERVLGIRPLPRRRFSIYRRMQLERFDQQDNCESAEIPRSLRKDCTEEQRRGSA